MSDNHEIMRALLARSSASRTTLGRQVSRSNWSSRFETWAKPLSDTEDQKCQNAQSVISSAIDGLRELQGLNIKVFAQGSYKANTNVRADSDVDINVRCFNTFCYSLPPDITPQSIPITPATLKYPTYRSKIACALYDRFTINGVKPGDKALKVKENTYRTSADVVPTFDYRQYYRIGTALHYMTGVCFFTSSGRFIVNWPDETLANGIAKNERTSRRYKKIVRVIKGLRNEMEAKGYESAKRVSSFQISCLVYNVMDGFFNNPDLYDDVKSVVGQIWYHAYEPLKSVLWTEVDGIKPMFAFDQPGRQKEVAAFFWDAMKYAELEDKS